MVFRICTMTGMRLWFVIFFVVWTSDTVTSENVCNVNCGTIFTPLPESPNLQSVIWTLYSEGGTCSAIECAVQCYKVREFCKAFAVDKKENCVLLTDGMQTDSRGYWINSNGSWTVYRQKNEVIEMPVFRISGGNGLSVYNTWLSTPPSSLSSRLTSQDLNLTTLLTTYYKHPLITDWENWSITKVTLYLYTNAVEVVKVELNGRGTTQTSWFSRSNLLSSPWGDLNTEAPVNYFVFSEELVQLYINSVFKGCPNDEGWLVILDGSDVCSWSERPPYPSLYYAKFNKVQNWNSNYLARADDLVISVHLEI